MRKAVVSFFSLVLVGACGATSQVSSSDSGAAAADAATDTTPDTAKTNPYDDPALVGPPVQSVIGRFHAGANLVIEADGTWRVDLMGCAGGLCGQGRWTGDPNTTITLVSDADAGLGESFPWDYSGTQVRSVTVSVVDGKLHTVTNDGRIVDFRDGFVCARCEHEMVTAYARCDKMRC